MSLAVPELSVDPRAVTLWRLQALVRLFTAGIPSAALLGFLAGRYVAVPAGVAIASLLLLHHVFLITVWPSLAYRALRYEVREHDLLVQSGVLFRQWSSVPLTRIQHVDTRQGPMERLFGLARLQVYTAAGMSADGSIAGLAEATAEALRDELSRRGGDDGV
jgi:hypothetical protein